MRSRTGKCRTFKRNGFTVAVDGSWVTLELSMVRNGRAARKHTLRYLRGRYKLSQFSLKHEVLYIRTPIWTTFSTAAEYYTREQLINQATTELKSAIGFALKDYELNPAASRRKPHDTRKTPYLDRKARLTALSS